MVEWTHPHLAWLLIPLGVAVLRALRSRPPAIVVSSIDHFAGTDDAPPRAWRAWRIPVLLEALAAAAFLAGLARPQLVEVSMPEEEIGSDIVLALDFSNSMDAVDLAPGQTPTEVEEALAEGAKIDRMAVARREIVRFVEARPADRIGLVIFGHRGYVACPPTLDHDYLVARTDSLSSETLPRTIRGTNIAAGIAAAVKTLRDGAPPDEAEEEDEDESSNDAQNAEPAEETAAPEDPATIPGARTVVLITDGRNSIQDEEFTPLEAAQFARDEGATLHAVALGSADPYMPESTGMQPPTGQLSMDEDTLERLVSYSGGRAFRATDNEGFARVMDEIDALQSSAMEREELIERHELFHRWVWGGLGLLLLALALRSTFLFTVS